MTTDLLIHSASQLLTLRGGPQRGAELGALDLIPDGAVAIREGIIQAVGPSADLKRRYRAGVELDASGNVVMPGFVDPHTHLIWAGDRAEEFELRVSGASYMQIMEAGGGILSTVENTRRATVEDLVREAKDRASRMLAHGTTTAEAKTGYGLDTPSELKILRAILKLDAEVPMDLIPTFLGAHAVPREYAADPAEYTRLVSDEMLPALEAWWSDNAGDRRLPFVDVFCEEGAFSLEQSRTILERAKALGFPVKIHSDEFKALGGTRLAVELSAVSADHLVKTPEKELQLLAQSNTVAVALPCTPFGLAEEDFTPAQSLLEAGGRLALATDLNPGTAWCESMQFVLAVACRYLSLTPAQAIAAATINAAAAINREDRIGSLEGGKQADVLILDTPDYRQLGYRFGTNLAKAVIKRGVVVFEGLI